MDVLIDIIRTIAWPVATVAIVWILAIESPALRRIGK